MRVMSYRKGPCRMACLTLGIIVSSLASACDADVGPTRKRPENIPSRAFFLGGVDGGIYLSIRDPEPSGDGMYYGQLFRDNGSKIYEGRLVLKPEDAEPVDVQAQGSFSAWDGDTLHMKDRRILRLAGDFPR